MIENFGEWIKDIRLSQNLTQSEFAEKLGLQWGKDIICKLEKNTRILSAEEFLIIAEKFGTKLFECNESNISSVVNENLTSLSERIEELDKIANTLKINWPGANSNVKEELEEAILSFIEAESLGTKHISINQLAYEIKNNHIPAFVLKSAKLISMDDIPYIKTSDCELVEQRNLLLSIVKKLQYQLETYNLGTFSPYYQYDLFDEEIDIDYCITDLQEKSKITKAEAILLTYISESIEDTAFGEYLLKYNHFKNNILDIKRDLGHFTQTLNEIKELLNKIT